jgi:hypothetical protein
MDVDNSSSIHRIYILKYYMFVLFVGTSMAYLTLQNHGATFYTFQTIGKASTRQCE